MSIACTSATIDTGLTYAVVAAMVLFSHETLADPTSTMDHGERRGETQSATIAESAIAPAASLSVANGNRRPSAKPRDDWELANQLLGPAKAGDRDAQYRLFATIDDCNNQMEFYFTLQGTPLTLDEGLEKAAKKNQEHQAQEWFDRCHQFQEHNGGAELGSADYWLQKATLSGQPLAQAVTARKQLDRDFLDTLVPLASDPKAGILISIPSGAQPDRRAVDLLRAAVKSLDPQVLEIIGVEQIALHGSRNAETVDQFAWIYVACQRGLNCSPTSRWAKDCPKNCDISTPEGIMMAWSREDWPAVQQRAKEIRAKLNAGRWDELGLGP